MQKIVLGEFLDFTVKNYEMCKNKNIYKVEEELHHVHLILMMKTSTSIRFLEMMQNP